jgi:signal peptidase I
MEKYCNCQKGQKTSVVLDGKTPIDFEYLLRDMDVTDGRLVIKATTRHFTVQSSNR